VYRSRNPLLPLWHDYDIGGLSIAVMESNSNSILVAERALEWIKEDSVVGLGSGRAAVTFMRVLSERVKSGLRIRCVPTSQATAEMATELGLPLVTLDQANPIDITVDGADEVDPKLDLIKGYGGALLREKIVAAASKRLVILVDSTKLVPVLGSRGVLPVEVIPFGLSHCRNRLAELGYSSEPRLRDGKPFVTDNGNHILDCTITAIADPASLQKSILAIPGVVETGLFLGLADSVLIQNGVSVEIKRRATNH
jgi:ribose 5-phosphate isomerase A